jgi:hypothetical protein
MVLMRLKVFLLALVVGVSVVSAAAAASPAGKGKPGKDDGVSASSVNGKKPPASGLGCRPEVMVILKGTLANAPGATPVLPFALQLKLSSANRFGEAFLVANQPITVTLTSQTKITRQGSKSLASLQSGDRVLIQARACKTDLTPNAATTAGTTATTTTPSAPTLPALTAIHIVAHPTSTN